MYQSTSVIAKGNALELYKRACVRLRVMKKTPLHKPDLLFISTGH